MFYECFPLRKLHSFLSLFSGKEGQASVTGKTQKELDEVFERGVYLSLASADDECFAD